MTRIDEAIHPQWNIIRLKWISRRYRVITPTKEQHTAVVKMQARPKRYSYLLTSLFIKLWDRALSTISISFTSWSSFASTRVTTPAKHPKMQKMSYQDTCVPRMTNPSMAVQNGAVLNPICATNMGRYLTQSILHVNPISPAIDLARTNFHLS